MVCNNIGINLIKFTIKSLCLFHCCTGTSTTADAVSIVGLIKICATRVIMILHGNINSILPMMIILTINRSQIIYQAQNCNIMWGEFISLSKSQNIIHMSSSQNARLYMEG